MSIASPPDGTEINADPEAPRAQDAVSRRVDGELHDIVAELEADAESIRIHFTHDGRELNPLEAKAPDFEAQRRRSRFRPRLANGKVRWPCACRSAGSSSSPSRYR